MEEWRAVPGWIGFYEVSDLGRVRSIDGVHPSLDRFRNPIMRRRRGQLLAQSKIKAGYMMVSLTRPGGDRRYAYVHDLVMEAFVGPKPPGLEVCHRHGRSDENHFVDLRYGTRSSNALDRHEHGTMNQARGTEHYFSKLSVADVKWIRASAGRMTHRDMADVLGVTHTTIGSVIRRVQWKHIP